MVVRSMTGGIDDVDDGVRWWSTDDVDDDRCPMMMMISQVRCKVSTMMMLTMMGGVR